MGPLLLRGKPITPECPQCGHLIHLTLIGPGVPLADGTPTYDGTLARRGLLIHLRVGCEGRTQ